MDSYRSQHIVPRCYLRPFLSPGIVYSSGSQYLKRVHSPKNVASSDWFYSAAGDASAYSLDRVNSFIEDNASGALREIRMSQTALSEGSKRVLSYFIANLYLRSPSTFQSIGLSVLEATEDIQKKMEELQELLAAGKGPPPRLRFERPGRTSWVGTPEEHKRRLESLREQVKSGKPLMHEAMASTLVVGQAISRMTWVLASTPSGSFFLTSSDPVALTHLNGSVIGVGWESTTALATLPLSPQRCLVMLN